MKILISLLLTLTTTLISSVTFAQATPMTLEGVFTFKGKIEPLLSVNYFTVYGFTEKGLAQLENLRQQGYACSNTGREIFLCEKADQVPTQPTSITSKVQKKYAKASIKFFKSTDAPAITNNSEDFKEWAITQKVQWDGQTFDNYHYSILVDSVHKIVLGDESTDNAVYFALTADPSLQYLYEEVVQSNATDPKKYTVYKGFVDLEK